MVYLTQGSLRDVRGIAEAGFQLRYPGEPDSRHLTDLDNINLLVGVNGGGKSTVLKALTLVASAASSEEWLDERWLRIGSDGDLGIDVDLVSSLGSQRSEPVQIFRNSARLTRGGRPSGQQLMSDQATREGVFCAYGPERAVQDRSRSVRSDFAGLSVSNLVANQGLDPIRIERLSSEQVQCVSGLLPADTWIEGSSFVQRGLRVPEQMLSDGLRSFLSWVGDLLERIGAAGFDRPRDAHGVVMVDELDQRMHPRWQQHVLLQLSDAFPWIQFIVAAHSPLLAASLRNTNLILMEPSLDHDGVGATRASRLSEDLFDRSADQVLESSYFGLDTSRGGVYRAELKRRAVAARTGDPEAALDYMSFLIPIDEERNALLPDQPRAGWIRRYLDSVRRIFKRGGSREEAQ